MTINVISLGAGVQSSTMALLASCGKITPMPDAAIFADTGDEPPSVYAYLNTLTPLLAFPVIRVIASSGDTLSVASTKLRERKDGTGSYVRQSIPGYVEKNGEPSILVRGCTRDYKIRPINVAIRRLQRRHEASKAVDWLGISTDEADRMAPSRERGITIRWPLIEMNMSRADCLSWMALNSLPQPPRSACVFCPFHSDAEWLRLRREEPEAFAAAIAYEERMHSALAQATRPTSKHGRIYLHKSLMPLRDVTFTENQRSGFGNECKGRCGV